MPDREKSTESTHAETAYGGADAVEKTSYVIGRGTDPEERQRGPVSARTDPGGGANPIAWLAIGLLLMVLLVYLAGFF